MELYILQRYMELKQFQMLKEELLEMQRADVAEFLNKLDSRSSLIVIRLLPKEFAADVFSYLSVDKQSELAELINDEELKNIINELNFDDKIDLIEEVPANIVTKILKWSNERERNLINRFLNFPEDSAGSLMTIEFVDLKKEMTVSEAMKRIRQIGLKKETIYTCYVTSHTKVLEGIISLRELVLADPNSIIEEMMEDEVIYVQTNEDQEKIADVFKKYDFLTLPVVDNENRLVGIITIDDIVDVIEQETTEDFQRIAAVEPSDEEYIDSSVLLLARKRIIWLAVLMASAFLTEIIQSNYSFVTERFLMLSFFVPMLTGTGGNAGAQASTLVIRSIALGELEFRDILKVLWRELRVGLIMGFPLAILNFTRLYYLQRYDFSMSLIVVLTMIGTVTFAAVMGGILPLIAQKLKLDPAIMANPLITTIVDASTLLIYFNIAIALLNI